MKNNLILKKFKKENVKGTYEMLEKETFFGGKLMDIEDEITISDVSVHYYQYYNVDDKKNGYQYYDLNVFIEKFYLLDVVNLKLKHHNIVKIPQSEIDEKNNTRWELNINIKNILREYLFAKIKARRTFKSIEYYDFLNNDINLSIYEYINLNLMDRYKFDSIDFYVKYIDIKNNNTYDNLTIKQYDPLFRSDIENINYKINNVNLDINDFMDQLADVKILYNQSKTSTEYKFDYYFNVKFKKI